MSFFKRFISTKGCGADIFACSSPRYRNSYDALNLPQKHQHRVFVLYRPFVYVMVVFFLACYQFGFAKQVIKMALLAPEGSSWMNIMHEFNKELEKETEGKVGFKFYAGGVLGDEKDVIRKIHHGQVHGVGLTGMGLGEIVPEVRILELPFFFQSSTEVDYLTSTFFDEYSKMFEKKNFVLLGFAENGFVHIFSQLPIAAVSDMKKAKMWSWSGDPLAQAFFLAYDISPVSMSITDVMSSLETKLINSFYAPPLAAIALQWFNKVKYITDVPTNLSIGGLLITKNQFKQLSGSQQKILRTLGLKYAKKINDQVRVENEISKKTLKNKGIQFVAVQKNNLDHIKKVGIAVREKLIGKLFPKELLEKMTQSLASFRGAQKSLAMTK